MRLSPAPKSIAILRALQLGDLMCAIPAFRAIRSAFPDAHITLIGLPWAREFARRFKYYFNSFLEFPGYPGLPERNYESESIVRFLHTVRRRRVDLVLQMHGDGSVVNPFVLLWGASQYAGFYRDGNLCPDPRTFLPYPVDLNPEPLRHLHLLDFLGIPAQGAHLEFPLTRADFRAFERLHLPLHRRRYVVIHPGARADTRLWTPAHFARLGDLARNRGLDVVVTGVESERGITVDVIRRMNRPPLDLTGCTTLGTLGVLVKDARLVVANDTGISHLADALATPSLIISLAHDPERWTPLDHNLHTLIRCRGGECFDEAADRLNETLRC